ncbi:MAG TPA: zinc ABC transporter substrate-binding protein [Desulforhopalus sp.]|nr:zinc ABC transporter substrate-binding protein [Desulforhopalus sp.]
MNQLSMTRRRHSPLVTLCTLLAAAALSLFAGPSCASAERLKVVTTLFPLYDWARVIGGDQAEVTLLLPPGVEAHSFDPKPKDIARIRGADIFLYTGSLMEPWVDGLLEGSTPENLLVIDASSAVTMIAAGESGEAEGGHHGPADDGHDHHHDDHSKVEAAHGDQDHHHDHQHHHGELDPHIWLEFTNAAEMVAAIADGFIARDPEHQTEYARRGEEYRQQLQALDQRYAAGLASCTHRTIIYGGHFAFGYLAERFALGHVSPYRGFAPDSEPSPGEMIELAKLMKDGKYKYIFYEEGIEPKVAKVIAAETGAGILLLHGAHNLGRDELAAGESYLSLMEANLERLRLGLECQ